MEQIELVIRLPKDFYDELKKNKDYYEGALIYACVIDGTPLPKGHGRLIDADKLVREYRVSNIVHHYGEQIVMIVDDSKTIIEADKEGA